jgi:hypothetical protein
MNKLIFYCPICKTELTITGQAHLETLSDHIFETIPTLKDVYQCPNNKCEANMRHFVWNELGEFYGNVTFMGIFIDNNSAPFGSLQRQLNIEIYKHDENRYFTYKGTGIKIEWKYKADTNGKILKKKPTIVILIKNTHYIPGIRMLWFTISQFSYARKRYIETQNDKWKKTATNYLFPLKGDKRWWKLLGCWICRTFYSTKLLQDGG